MTRDQLVSKFRPFGPRVLVKRVKADDKTASGIVIPDAAQQKKNLGEVVKVGPGRLRDDGTRAEMSCKVGDTVLFGSYSGTNVVPVDDSTDEFIILYDEDLMGACDVDVVTT